MPLMVRTLHMYDTSDDLQQISLHVFEVNVAVRSTL